MRALRLLGLLAILLPLTAYAQAKKVGGGSDSCSGKACSVTSLTASSTGNAIKVPAGGKICLDSSCTLYIQEAVGTIGFGGSGGGMLVGDSNASMSVPLTFTSGAGIQPIKFTGTSQKLCLTSACDNYIYKLNGDRLYVVGDNGVRLAGERVIVDTFIDIGGNSTNGLQVSGASTGNAATITATGGDTDVGLALFGKGAGLVSIQPGASAGATVLKIPRQTAIFDGTYKFGINTADRFDVNTGADIYGALKSAKTDTELLNTTNLNGAMDHIKMATGGRLHIGQGTTDYFASDGGVIFTPGALVAGSFSYADGVPGYGAYASRPTAAYAGRHYVCNDCPIGQWIDTGSAWAPLVAGQVVGVQPKAAASFTRFNNGSSNLTLVDRKGAIHLSYPVDGSTQDVGGFTESLSSSTAHVEAAFVWNFARSAYVGSSFPGAGVCMRESGTGKVFYVALVAYNDTTGAGSGTGIFNLEASYWASGSTRTGGVTGSYDMPRMNGPVFLKTARSGSNMVAQFSTDAQNWTTFYSVATTTAFTTAPDSVGVCGQVWNATDGVEADYVSYNSGT